MMQKRVIVRILLIAIMSFSFLPIWQVAASQTEAELVVDGDEMIIDTENNIIEFIGNVVAKYLDYQIQGDKLLYEEDKDFLKIEGQVKLNIETMSATAQSMELQLEQEFLTMTGDVKVFRDGKVIQGNVVTYDLKTGIMRVKNAHLEITGDK
ncbi:MAG: LPS export ABC transporter periplasmic protein LptC [Halanaerobiales bacterium]|nr:LPS export ABC transporter periplasmic protein LptC [Halanaerobiales bacterium]